MESTGKDGSVTRRIALLQAGDEDALEELWQRYFKTLVGYVRSRLATRWTRAKDEEDVALSVFNSLWKGMQDGRFPNIGSRDSLWRILLTMASRKAATAVKHEQRQKRGRGQVVRESEVVRTKSEFAENGLEAVLSKEPTPEFAAMMAEECDRLLTMLDEPVLCTIASLKIEGHTNREIAQELGCSLRSVERKLARIRTEWKGEVPNDG